MSTGNQPTYLKHHRYLVYSEDFQQHYVGQL